MPKKLLYSTFLTFHLKLAYFIYFIKNKKKVLITINSHFGAWWRY